MNLKCFKNLKTWIICFKCLFIDFHFFHAEIKDVITHQEYFLLLIFLACFSWYFSFPMHIQSHYYYFLQIMEWISNVYRSVFMVIFSEQWQISPGYLLMIICKSTHTYCIPFCHHLFSHSPISYLYFSWLNYYKQKFI